MGESLAFGAIASSALVLGAVAGSRLQIPKRVLAAMLSFAAGALITALAFELFEDSYEQGGIWRAALGLMVGAVVFTVVSQRLDRAAEGSREVDHGSEKLDTDAAAQDAAPSPSSVSGAAGMALLQPSPSTEYRRTSLSVCRSAKAAAVSHCSRPSSSPTFRRPWWAVLRCERKAARMPSFSAPGLRVASS